MNDSEFLLVVRAQLRKFWWNLTEQLTLLISSAVLVGLFIYIFRDFFNVQLASLSQEVANRGKICLSIFLSFVLAVLSARWCRNILNGKDGILPLLNRIGGSSSQKRNLKRSIKMLAIVSAGLCSAGFSWLFVNAQTTLLMTIFSIFFCGCLVVSKRLGFRRMKRLVEPNNQIFIKDWRWYQIVQSSIPGKRLMIVGVIASVLLPMAALTSQRLIFIQLVALLGGFIAALGVVQAISKDLQYSWFEKQTGMTQDTWLRSWQKIVNRISLFQGTLALLAVLILPQSLWSEGWSIIPLAAFLPWLVPSLALQIDGRSIVASSLVVALVALFLGTLLIAVPLAVILVPLIKSQAWAYQQGRFYRA